MSIYRKFDREPSNDMHARPVKRVDPPQPTAPPASSPRGGPPVDPMPLTIEWAAKLPGDVRPMALIRAFPRIANFIAANWPTPTSLSPYLDELFVDRRGNRRGFPPDVMEELFALRAYYEELHPTHDRRWDQSQHHR
jgi:hypothetical protein